MNLKSILSTVVLLLAAVITAPAENQKKIGNIEFKDPVSGVVFNIDNAIINDSTRYDYRKALIYTKNTAISIWSAPNPEKKPFSWKKINEFDSNNRFGTMTRQERMKNADGWIRHYNFVDKKNKQWAYCVALIRGNNYALYLVESALKADQLTIPQLLENTDLGEIDKRAANEGKSHSFKYWLTILMGVVLAGLAKLLFRNRDGVFLTCGAVTALAVAATLYWVFYSTIGESLLWGFLLTCLWIGVWAAKSWTEFFNFIGKALNSI